MVNLESNSVPHNRSLTHPPQWDGGENWKRREVELIGWDKNYLLRQKRKKERSVMMIIYVYNIYLQTGDAQHNCSPPVNQCSSSNCTSSQLPGSVWCHIVWNISLASLGQLSGSVPSHLLVPPTQTPIPGRTVWEAENLVQPLLCTALLSNY